MKSGHYLLIIASIGLALVFSVDFHYVGKLKEEFKTLEKERIIISNKLATAKIVQENLNHVKELVTHNMDFPGNRDTISQDSHFFHFLTNCINDLKLSLVSVQPFQPQTQGRKTTCSYRINIDGDFFKFVELCAKFENSRRIINISDFSISLREKSSTKKNGLERKGISVNMLVNTYRIKKSH